MNLLMLQFSKTIEIEIIPPTPPHLPQHTHSFVYQEYTPTPPYTHPPTPLNGTHSDNNVQHLQQTAVECL